MFPVINRSEEGYSKQEAASEKRQKTKNFNNPVANSDG
jgi:hypothetical protein